MYNQECIYVVNYMQERRKLIKSVGANILQQATFVLQKTDSYGQLIKSVGAFAPTAPPIPAPMIT